MDDELQEIKHRLGLYDALLLEPEGDGSLMGRFFAVAHSRGSDIQRLLARVEELESKLEDAHLAHIKAQNPGIDIEAVKRERASARG